MMGIPNRVRVVAVLSALALAGGLLTLGLLAKHTQAAPPPPRKGRCIRAVPDRLHSRYYRVRRW
jgi:hypothetical protein